VTGNENFSVKNIRDLHLQSIYLMLPAPHVESMFYTISNLCLKNSYHPIFSVFPLHNENITWKTFKLTNNSVEERCVFFTNQSNSLPYIDYSVGTYPYKLLHKLLVMVLFLQLLEIVAFKRLRINIFSVKILEIYIYNLYMLRLQRLM
jgi:hypothetical protein